MSVSKKIIIKSEVDEKTVSKTMEVDSTCTLQSALNFGRKYVALTSGTGKTVTLQEITETSGSIDEDA